MTIQETEFLEEYNAVIEGLNDELSGIDDIP